MSGINTPPAHRPSVLHRLANGLHALIGIGLSAWFAGANLIPPWDFRIKPTSTLELSLAIAFTLAVTVACAWRLIAGSSAEDELQRFEEAGGDVDLGGALASVDDASD